MDLATTTTTTRHALLLLAAFLLILPCCLANPKTSKLECYVCNSQEDPDCDDPFENRDKFLMRCQDVDKRENATLCRKSWQEIKGEHRIYRTCGWLKHDKYDCYWTGAEHYRTYVCACDEDRCNAASGLVPPTLLAFLVVPLARLVGWH